MAQYSALRCVSCIWQNNEEPLISNGLRFIVTYLLTAALWVLFHVARHSWATIARNECGISMDDVAMALNHKSGHDVTDTYVKKDWGRIDKANRAVIDFVFGKL